MLARAVDAWHDTGGRYDPTVLAALEAAGYDRDFDAVARTGGADGPTGPGTAPGCGDVELDDLVRAVRLPLGVTIDLGGIGKGAAADEVSAGLLAAGVPGVTGVLVNLGGDLRARGDAPAPHGWVVDVDDPLRTGRAGLLALGEGAVATSTRLRRTWTRGDRSLHHLIDPRTGAPADAGLASVTVVAGEAWRAEVLAKAAFVAGPATAPHCSKPPGPPACSSPTTATWWSCPGSTGFRPVTTLVGDALCTDEGNPMAETATRDERWYLPKYETVEEERQHRKQRLAAGFRIFGKFGFEEGVAGHITARDPERLDHFWVNPFGMSFSHIRVSDLILVNSQGEVVEGDGSVNTAAFAIHSALHEARPDIIAAAHSHSLYGKAWSSLGRLLDPLTQDACAFYDDHALFDDFTGVVLDQSEGKRIGVVLEDRKAVILRNHGLLTVGHSVEETVWWYVTMERSCQAQLLAEAAGTPIPIADDVARLTLSQVGAHVSGYASFQPLWQKITREQPDLFE